jgi:branched-chain amino acid aminotransferase
VSEPFVFVRDNFVPASQASILIGDLAIQRGYGIFDFFKTLGGNPVFLEDHLDRFFHSARQLRLETGKTREELHEILDMLQQKNKIPDSGIRLTLTGGYSPDGYSLTSPNLIITQQPLAATITGELQKGIRLVTYPHQRQMPEVKTIDYLMAIWLQPFIRENGADDVLYHRGGISHQDGINHPDGIITECPRSNFFMVTAEDTIVTPARNILKGITRMKVLEVAGRRFRTEERDMTLEELKTAKEAFITSTTKHILPVLQIDDIIIGKGSPEEEMPGDVSRWLNKELYALALN